MPKKQTFLIVDSETSITDKVADFGAVLADRNGVILKQCAVMVREVFGVDPLFYDRHTSGIWAQSSVTRRTENYNAMLVNGARMLASVAAINRWLERIRGEYDPILTAYNLAFDSSKARNTGIDLAIFSDRFCLWHAAGEIICKSKKYRQFIVEHHLFNARTDLGNMTYKTDAETVAGFLCGEIKTEPHTAIEDAIEFELPILKHILKRRGWREKLTPYNWKAYQVRDHFGAK